MPAAPWGPDGNHRQAGRLPPALRCRDPPRIPEDTPTFGGWLTTRGEGRRSLTPAPVGRRTARVQLGADCTPERAESPKWIRLVTASARQARQQPRKTPRTPPTAEAAKGPSTVRATATVPAALYSGDPEPAASMRRLPAERAANRAALAANKPTAPHSQERQAKGSKGSSGRQRQAAVPSAATMKRRANAGRMMK